MKAARRTRAETDGGVTLVELILAILIGTIITGAVANALLVGLRTTDKTTERLGESHDTQLVANWFPNDVASAAPTGISVGPSAATECADSEPGTTVVLLPYASGRGDVPESSAYRFDASANRLIRYHCAIGLPDERIVVASRVSEAVAEITNPDGQTMVTLTVTATDTGRQFKVTGYSRTPTPPSSLPTTSPPTSAETKPCTVHGIPIVTPDPSQLTGGGTLVDDIEIEVELLGYCVGPFNLAFTLGGTLHTPRLDALGIVTLGRSDYDWTAGTTTVTVEQFEGGAVLNPTFTFTVQAPAAPTIDSVDPKSLGVGALDRDMVLTGTNFVDGASVEFSNGVEVNSTTFDSATRLTVNVSLTDATPGPVTITVDNNDDGPIGSNDTAFTVNPAPTMDSVDPTSVTRGSSDVAVVIAGTNFGSTVTVVFERSDGGDGDVEVAPAKVDSSAQVTVVVNVGSAGDASGVYDVVLRNADGGTATKPGSFEVTS